MMMLQVRQRCGSEKSVADAHWNIGVLLRELHQPLGRSFCWAGSVRTADRCSGATRGKETESGEFSELPRPPFVLDKTKG